MQVNFYFQHSCKLFKKKKINKRKNTTITTKWLTTTQPVGCSSLPMQTLRVNNTLPPHLRWLLVHGSVWWTPLCCGAHHQTWLTQSQSVGHLSSSQHECLVSEQVKTQRTREVGKSWVWLANTDMVIINWLIAEQGYAHPSCIIEDVVVWTGEKDVLWFEVCVCQSCAMKVCRKRAAWPWVVCWLPMSQFIHPPLPLSLPPSPSSSPLPSLLLVLPSHPPC